MMVGEYFSEYIEEVICRKDLYPGYNIIPTRGKFGKKKKNLFFPQFGRTTKLENIASPPYIGMFECNCLSCSDFYERGIFNKKECLAELAHSNNRKDYHNYHSFLLKLDSSENIEQYPNQLLDNIKLGTKWRKALNE
jgi:hypothetical protein